ncbi:hypothetical protein R6Q59_012905 [Mikania micrantha]
MLAWKTRHGLTWINSRSRLQVYPSAIWILGLYPLPEKKLISVYSSLLLSSPANIQSPPPVTIATPMIVIIPTTRRLLGVATLQHNNLLLCKRRILVKGELRGRYYGLMEFVVNCLRFFAIGQSEESFDDPGSGTESVICMTESKDTVVLPCWDMCLCIECAKTLRFQSKCPICYQPIEELAEIKINTNEQ